MCHITEEPHYFVKDLTDIALIEKETAVFHCTTNKPNLSIKWYFENGQITENEKFKVESDGVDHKLTIHNCSFEDEGRFKAAIGPRQTSGSLTIKGNLRFF